MGLSALVRLSALIRRRASGSRSGALAVPQTAEPLTADCEEPAAPALESGGRVAAGLRSALLGGPLATEAGETARAGGARRGVAGSGGGKGGAARVPPR